MNKMTTGAENRSLNDLSSKTIEQIAITSHTNVA